MEDQKIRCVWPGCEQEFIHRVRDQEFYEKMKFKPPKFCHEHRAEAKAARESRKQEQERKKSSPFNPRNWREGDRALLMGE